MTTVTLPRKRVEDALESFADLVDGASYTHEDDEIGHRPCCGEVSYRPHAKTCRAFNHLSALRAALDMSTQSTHQENMSKKDENLNTSSGCMRSHPHEDMDAECEAKTAVAREQNRMRSEYLTNKHKTDWSAA